MTAQQNKQEKCYFIKKVLVKYHIIIEWFESGGTFKDQMVQECTEVSRL